MERNILVCIIFCLVSLGASKAMDPGKKAKKEIARLFGDGTELHLVQIPAEEEGIRSFFKDGDGVFKIVSDKSLQGYLLLTQTKGRFDLFDYFVVFTEELEVLSAVVTIYRSNHGAAVCSKHWLRQFSGYSGGKLDLGKDIDSISGATISATSLVKDMERNYLLMSALKKNSIIP